MKNLKIIAAFIFLTFLLNIFLIKSDNHNFIYEYKLVTPFYNELRDRKVKKVPLLSKYDLLHLIENVESKVFLKNCEHVSKIRVHSSRVGNDIDYIVKIKNQNEKKIPLCMSTLTNIVIENKKFQADATRKILKTDLDVNKTVLERIGIKLKYDSDGISQILIDDEKLNILSSAGQNYTFNDESLNKTISRSFISNFIYTYLEASKANRLFEEMTDPSYSLLSKKYLKKSNFVKLNIALGLLFLITFSLVNLRQILFFVKTKI